MSSVRHLYIQLLSDLLSQPSLTPIETQKAKRYVDDLLAEGIALDSIAADLADSEHYHGGKSREELSVLLDTLRK